MKRMLACALTAVLAISTIITVGFSPAKAETNRVELAELSYQASATDAETDLADTYGSKKEGYHFTAGALSDSALLFASVSGKGLETATEDDPSTEADESYSPLRKIEWSKAEYTIDETTGNVVPVMTAGKKNLWGATPYFLIQFSTTGYENIHFSTELSGSSKGPKNMKLQYSTDGLSFTDIADSSYTIPNEPSTKIMKTAYDLDLTGEAFSNQSKLYIRIIATDNATINPDDPANDPGFEGASGGELAINNIKISGTAIPVATPTPTPAPVQTQTPSITPTSVPAPTTVSNQTTAKKQIFKLNKKKLTLKKGKTYKLKLTCSPKSLGKKLTWKSSKKKVATVSKTGRIKALKKGKTTITVKNKTGKKATCQVTVKK